MFPETTPEPEGKVLMHINEQKIQLSPEVACILASHRSSVFCCRWSPVNDQLATASEDSTVILWNIKDGISTRHEVIGKPDIQSSDSGVSCIDWDVSGHYIAAGTLDAQVHIFSNTGSRIATLSDHNNNIFSVQFNPSGTLLVTAGADHKAIVWDTSTFSKLQSFDFHKDTILDVTWKDDKCFITASADHTIGVCTIGNTGFVVLTGHKAPVSVVSFNPSRTCLASASEDKTIKLWRSQNNNDSVVLNGHEKAVSALKWVPENDFILVSGALDGTIRLWDTIQYTCLYVIQAHQNEIFAISCSPNGKYIASGSNDATITVSSVTEGKKILMFTGNSEVYDVQWSKDGNYIAAAFDDSTVAIIPFQNYIGEEN
ncbi:F-box-like/WD repeat-containing protein TBL1XR1 isoform X2 [Histomonas meleagridis]|uniref:F-box-like/WD repeat-containing protein TBL1XR1 isoform X2 n=1 Tax=Histomonas meleagridis TaxID=135588 RepID=UPI003559740A|nr:F-box-like/WD repeat-containing protein TBL1XR1 isoform X2 [Histomonas meleagridis]KAH0803242.1 F-box-like/WD repeat-containing protein TBL1XR1 isoform X2 [Histomonas meleagridis]